MPLSHGQLQGLIGLIALTTDDEITCLECLLGMAEFAERELAGRNLDAALIAVRDHIAFCPECREEYDTLLLGLAAMEAAERTDSGVLG